MKNNLKLIAAVLLFIVLGCGGGGGTEWKGKISGTTTITKTDLKVTPVKTETVYTGSGSATLEHGIDFTVRLGKDTPIPDCVFTFYEGSRKRDSSGLAAGWVYRLKDQNNFHTGERDDGKGCLGMIDNGGPLTGIYVEGGAVEITEEGEFSVVIYYGPGVQFDIERMFVLTGRKGWF